MRAINHHADNLRRRKACITPGRVAGGVATGATLGAGFAGIGAGVGAVVGGATAVGSALAKDCVEGEVIGDVPPSQAHAVSEDGLAGSASVSVEDGRSGSVFDSIANFFSSLFGGA